MLQFGIHINYCHSTNEQILRCPSFGGINITKDYFYINGRAGNFDCSAFVYVAQFPLMCEVFT